MTPVAILLVEDDDVLLTLLKTSLEDYFCTVSSASDAGQAVQLLCNTRFDLVLTDLQLGVTSGLDVVRKAKECVPNALIFMMSGCNDPERMQAAYLCGADEYLVKPFSIHSLVERLQQQGLSLWQPVHPGKVAGAKRTTGFCQNILHPGKDLSYT